MPKGLPVCSLFHFIHYYFGREINMIFVKVQKINRDILRAQYDRLFMQLAPARRMHVMQIKNQKAAEDSLAAGLLLQKVLAEVCNMSPEETVCLYGQNGKPYIDHCPDFHFNLSHSGDYVAIAYGDMELGMDLEVVRDYRPEILKRFCSENERKFVECAIQADRLANFFTLWTMKECYVKYTGEGLSKDFRAFEIDFESQRIRNTNENLWTIKKDDMVVSVCAKDVSRVKFEIVS